LPAPESDAGQPPDSGGSDAKGARPPTPSRPGKIVLVAGGGSGGDGTPALMASTNKPFGAVTDPINGDVYIAEYGGHKIRRIDDKGIISTVMGAGATGPGAKITLGRPHNLLFQPNTRNLFVGDTFAGRVIKMDAATGESVVFAVKGYFHHAAPTDDNVGKVALTIGNIFGLGLREFGKADGLVTEEVPSIRA